MAEMGSAEANLFLAALSALIEWFTTALLHRYSALSQAQAETWRAKLGGRRLEGADWRAQQAAPLQSAIYAPKPRGSKLLRCGAQTPSFDLRRKRSEGNRERSYLVPAKAVTWRFAPQRRSLLPRFFGPRFFGPRSFGPRSFSPRLFTGTDLRSPA